MTSSYTFRDPLNPLKKSKYRPIGGPENKSPTRKGSEDDRRNSNYGHRGFGYEANLQPGGAYSQGRPPPRKFSDSSSQSYTPRPDLNQSRFDPSRQDVQSISDGSMSSAASMYHSPSTPGQEFGDSNVAIVNADNERNDAHSSYERPAQLADMSPAGDDSFNDRNGSQRKREKAVWTESLYAQYDPPKAREVEAINPTGRTRVAVQGPDLNPKFLSRNDGYPENSDLDFNRRSTARYSDTDNESYIDTSQRRNTLGISGLPDMEPSPLIRRHTEAQIDFRPQHDITYQRPRSEALHVPVNANINQNYQREFQVWQDGLIDLETGENPILNRVYLKIDTQCEDSNWVSELTVKRLDGARIRLLSTTKTFCGFNGEVMKAEEVIRLSFREMKGGNKYGHGYTTDFYIAHGKVPFEMVLGARDIAKFEILGGPDFGPSVCGLAANRQTQGERNAQALSDREHKARVEAQEQRRRNTEARRSRKNTSNTDHSGGSKLSSWLKSQMK